MKYSWAICLALSGAAFLIGGCDLNFNRVDNPDYAAWKGFPAGSGFEFDGMQQVAAGNPRRIHITGDLMSMDKTQAVIKRRTQVFNPGGPGELEFVDVTLPARILKTENPMTRPDTKESFRGWDSVLVGDSLYNCEVHYYIVKQDAERLGVKTQGETGIKIWQCKKIPGGIAKIEMTGLSPDNVFTLSGQVVNFNVSAAPVPQPAASQSATPATQESPESQPTTTPSTLPAMPQPDKRMQTSGLDAPNTQPTDELPQPKVILPVEKPAEEDKKSFEEVPEKIEPVAPPAIRPPDPELLSEIEEQTASPKVILPPTDGPETPEPATSQPTTEPAITPVAPVAPKKLENDTEPLPGFVAPAGNVVKPDESKSNENTSN